MSTDYWSWNERHSVFSINTYSHLDIECCVVDFLELSPIMELVFIPQSLVFVDIKVIHTWLADLFVRRASLNDLSLKIIIECKVVVSESSRTR